MFNYIPKNDFGFFPGFWILRYPYFIPFSSCLNDIFSALKLISVFFEIGFRFWVTRQVDGTTLSFKNGVRIKNLAFWEALTCTDFRCDGLSNLLAIPVVYPKACHPNLIL